MTVDKTTKFLLAVIAFGVLMTAVRLWIFPERLPAFVLFEHIQALENIESTLTSIESGTCPNSSICG